MTSEADEQPAHRPTGASPGAGASDDRNARRRAAALSGHDGDADRARSFLGDPDAGVRSTALRALARAAAADVADLTASAADPEAEVRRAAAEVIADDHDGFALDDLDVPALLGTLLADPDASVVEVAAWATGEWVGRMVEAGLGLPQPDLVAALGTVTLHHEDALCREAAVAALGAIGDDAALSVILAATTDKATVRRRAVIALAPFDGDEVTAALERARDDRDWQVRQAAEDLLLDDDEPSV